ncbi:Dabb family protein [Candidatus Thiosymbion oneisti]|uniref:Dabb family protein n=1 Tax=Candidatus Thiosymbion oneisti TaxID=589554 RepID=UPI00105F2287|nr:Dabb family protein [Candidatus Thiosymbion oneisti]
MNKIRLPVVLILLFIGCVSTATKAAEGTQVKHIVLCWLKESGNPAHRHKIIETSRSFRKIPRVLKVSAGEVIPSDREIVDDSFDVAIMLTFANTDDMNAYLEHPLHKDAVQKVR